MPPTHTPNSWLEVDLAAVEANTRRLVAAAGGAVLCGVVKKDAYGLGAVLVSRALERAGAGMLAVFEPWEALPIAAAGVGLPFLVFAGTLGPGDAWGPLAEAGRLEFQLGDPAEVDRLDAEGRRRGVRLAVHVHADTGMSREGMPVDAAAAVARAVLAGEKPGLRLAGLMTHLATAGTDRTRAEAQVARFDALLASVGPLPGDAVAHLASTDGLLREPSWRRGMVRPGLGVYGYATPADPGLTHAVRWVSRVQRVLEVPAGSAVGYEATEVADRPTRLGLVPVGYGDGYARALSGRGVVRVAGAGRRVVGRVSMDQLMVDLTDHPAAAAGDEAELFGVDPEAGNALPALAAAAGTHAYELLTRVHPRVKRTMDLEPAAAAG